MMRNLSYLHFNDRSIISDLEALRGFLRFSFIGRWQFYVFGGDLHIFAAKYCRLYSTSSFIFWLVKYEETARTILCQIFLGNQAPKGN